MFVRDYHVHFYDFNDFNASKNYFDDFHDFQISHIVFFLVLRLECMAAECSEHC